MKEGGGVIRRRDVRKWRVRSKGGEGGERKGRGGTW